MKKSIILLGIAASLLAVSCSKMSPVGENGIKEKVSLGAVLEQQASETKTALSGSTVVWSQGDQLSVLSTENAEGGDVFTLKDASAGQTSGEFEGNLTAADQYYALYPYAATAELASGTVSFPVPATQEYVANGFANGANASIAPFTLATKDNVNFKNVFGVLKLSLKAGGEAITVNSIVVSDKSGKAMNGTASVAASAVSSGNPVATVTGGSNSITLNCSSPVIVTSTAAVDFYIVVPAGVFANGFTVTANCADGYRTVSTTKDNTIHRSYIREMPEIALPSTAETSVDLSAEGTANCYVVPTTTATLYKFKATVKGNETTPSITPTNAVLVWETDNTATEIAANSIVSTPVLEGEYVKFTATGKAGNALIAVRDAENNILWSWHIWCVSGLNVIDGYPGEQGCLDRNVGALSATPGDPLTMGLYYLWGRKDPFSGPVGFSNSSSPYYMAGTPITLVNGSISVDNSIKNPTVYHRGGLSPVDGTRWSETKKTIYDVCPVGYRIAPSSVLEGLQSEQSNNGLVFKNVTSNLGYYPLGGFRSNTKSGNFDAVDSAVMLWTSKCTSTAYFLSSGASATTTTVITAGSNTNCGLPIRCCRDNSRTDN